MFELVAKSRKYDYPAFPTLLYYSVLKLSRFPSVLRSAKIRSDVRNGNGNGYRRADAERGFKRKPGIIQRADMLDYR